MAQYYECPKCSRYVKVHEGTCPFCASQNHPAQSAVRMHLRVSRGEWLAFGSTLSLLGCTMGDPVIGVADASVEHPASTSTGGKSQNLYDASIAADASYACGDQTCSASKEFCYHWLSDGSYSCRAYPDGIFFPEDAGGCAARASCDCYANITASCSCAEADGGVVVSCHSCYGAPPARLERFV